MSSYGNFLYHAHYLFDQKEELRYFQGATPQAKISFPLFIMYKGIEKTFRIISIMKNEVFTTPYWPCPPLYPLPYLWLFLLSSLPTSIWVDLFCPTIHHMVFQAVVRVRRLKGSHSLLLYLMMPLLCSKKCSELKKKEKTNYHIGHGSLKNRTVG